MFGDALTPAKKERGSFAHLWWLNPIWPLALMLLCTGYAAYVIPYADYVANWKTPKYLNGDDLRFICQCVAGFAGAGFLVSLLFKSQPPAFGEVLRNDPRIPWPTLWFVFRVGYVLTLLAYVIWVALAAQAGLSTADLMAALHNDPEAAYIIRDKTDTLPGVTTFTQVAMAVVLLGTLLGFKFGWRKNLVSVVLPLTVVVGLAVIRARFRDERIAVLELVVPMGILGLALLRTEKWPAFWRGGLASLPFVAPIGLYLFFSAAEYSRSWVNFYQEQGESSFFWFTFTRLVGYYVTALNNGACFVQTIGRFKVPYHSLEWFWKLPPVKTLFPYPGSPDREPLDGYVDILRQKLNPELNNSSGVFVLQLDYGYLGGIAAWCVVGAIAMLLYRLFRRGSVAGLLLYPLFYVGLLESPRILYWTASRSFASWVVLLGVVVLIALARQGDWRKRRSLSPAQPSTTKPALVRRPARRGL